MAHAPSTVVHKPNLTTIEYILAAVSISGFVLLLFGSALHAQFALIDDHEILRFASPEPLHPQIATWNGPISSLWEIAIERELSLGRFRPVYYVFRFAEVAALGTNPLAWHLTTLCLGVLTLFLLYVTMRECGADHIASAALVLLVTSYGQYLWVRLGPAETLGMLLTVLSLWTGVKSAQQDRPGWFWDSLSLTVMSLAGLVKESFILLIPSVLLLRLMLQSGWFHTSGWRQTIRDRWPVICAGGLVFMAELTISLLLLMRGGYGATIVNRAFDPKTIYVVFGVMSGIVSFVPALSAFLILPHWPGKQFSDVRVVFGLIVFAGWVLPQLILFKGGSLSGHYLYPAVLGTAVLNAAGLAVMRRKQAWFLWASNLAWTLAAVGIHLVMAHNYTNQFTADTQALDHMVSSVSETVGEEQVIVLAVYPDLHYEPSVSLIQHLGNKGASSPIYVYPVDTAGESAAPTSNLARTLTQRIFAGYTDVDTLTSDQVGVIILLAPMDGFLHNPPTWYTDTEWHIHAFTEPFYRLGISGYRLEEATYQVLERNKVD